MDGTLRLDDDQDRLIRAVAKANPKTIVVLESGGAVLMPWIDDVAAILEAWYPGTSGGEAIARVLTGEVNPSGRLPVTFPASLEQLPRPTLDGYPEQRDARINVDYTIEGAAVGYKWFDRQGLRPLYAFGYGLSYTDFAYSNLHAEAHDGHLSVRFTIKNTGERQGRDVAQIYVSPLQPTGVNGWEAPKRLCGFQKVNLNPGGSTEVNLDVDPRLLAVYDSARKKWVIAAGDYSVILSRNARTPVIRTTVHFSQQML
jgi:beta-glucosidase